MTRFRNRSDFLGTYVGRNDGRRARLEIRDTKADSPWPMFHITFTDLDRDVTARGLHQERGSEEHVLTDIELEWQGQSGTKNMKSLHLHTWNTDYLSGISLWRGREFGMLFERQ